MQLLHATWFLTLASYYTKEDQKNIQIQFVTMSATTLGLAGTGIVGVIVVVVVGPRVWAWA